MMTPDQLTVDPDTPVDGPAAARRAAAVTMLRAVADLLEAHPDLPEPGISISFYTDGPDTPATMAAIATALPCRWQPGTSASNNGQWLDLVSTGLGADILRGVRVRISAPARDACTPTGTKTVTTWQLTDALASLTGSGALESGVTQ
jgi:hypothetical protein